MKNPPVPLLFAAAVLSAMVFTSAGVMAQPVDLPAQAFGESQPIPGRYIVVFKDSVPNPAAEAANLMRGRGGQVHFTYSHAIKGFAATIPHAAYQAIRMNPNVEYIEQDQTVSLSATTTQSNATWGLDRIDQRDLPLSNTYMYDATGAGVYAYIIDTGIRASHSEFGGRVIAGYTAISDNRGTNDCNGHGTHVAGTVGGTVYGVAKQVKLVPVRVLDCRGSGTTSGVIAGVDYVAASLQRPAVGNMSLGGGAYKPLDDAVKGAVGQGVTMVVAAGNSNANACNYSPAREPTAVTVGATTSTDARASYSNFGNCLDLFAPGSSITSAWYSSNTATNTLSGTSMASPHVAGVAALVLQGNNAASPASVTDTILLSATPNKVTSAGSGSPNRLLYSLVGGDTQTNQPPTASFTFACTVLTCTFDGSGSSDLGGSIASYAWNFGDGSTGSGVTTSRTYGVGGTYTVTLTVTDNGGATGTGSQSVTVSSSSGGTSPVLTGSSTSQGSTWTATVTLTGLVGDATQGTWNTEPNETVGCEIEDGASCSRSLPNIRKNVGSVTYTDGSGLGSVTITKP
jgi:subtilisin family serine protease